MEDAYFERVDETSYRPTGHVGGAWTAQEQHIAPALGLLAHAIELDRDRRRDDGLQLSRFSCDILGVVPLDVVGVDVGVLRPGRTIELVEARLHHRGRAAVLARAWLSARYDTEAVSGTGFVGIGPRDPMPEWDPTQVWPGGFIGSVQVRRAYQGPGRAAFWVRPTVPILAGEPVSSTARLFGLVDVANGVVPRVSPQQVAFPNLDLTAHVFRSPDDGWIGFDTTVSFGGEGVGLTHSVIHDSRGPLGAVAQTLTVRPGREP